MEKFGIRGEAKNWRATLYQSNGTWDGVISKGVEEITRIRNLKTLARAKTAADNAIQKYSLERSEEAPGPIQNWEPFSIPLPSIGPIKIVDRWFIRSASVIGVLVGLLSLVAALVINLPSGVANKTNERLESQVNDLTKSVSRHQDELVALAKARSESSSFATSNEDLLSVKSDIKILQDKIKTFEDAIGDDATRRLAVPMLRKDIDILRDEHRNDLLSLHEELNRTFELMKWLLGIVGAASVLGGIGNWVRRKSSPVKEESEE